uniref:Glycoprotein n=1 Tax=Strongyloides papillosus TaxID=174720 RepID=A0A0N5CIF7_STREA
MYFIVTVLALVELSIYSQGTTHEHLFPDIPKNLETGTFPYDITIYSRSDVVAVKCPTTGYHHNSEISYFYRNDDYILYKPLPKAIIGWKKIKTLDYRKIRTLFCGETEIYKTVNGTSIHFGATRWEYTITWKDNPDPNKLAIEGKEYAYSESIPEKCGLSIEDLIILQIKRDGQPHNLDISKTEEVSDELLFYFFKKPNETDELNYMYVEPCLVLDAFNFCPQITILDLEHTTVQYKGYQILAFKLNEDKETTFNIALNLQIGGRSLGYYNKDNVAITRMLNFKNTIDYAPMYSDYSDSTFTIFGYELVQLEYYCKDEEIETPRSRLLFFGPKDDNLQLEERIYRYYD